jgi:ketosteroid isomerase-like protein
MRLSRRSERPWCHRHLVSPPAARGAGQPLRPPDASVAGGRGQARNGWLGAGAALAVVAIAAAAGAAKAPAQAAATAAGGDLAAARAALADTERAFSRLSRQQGMRTAFLAYLADDAVIFRPGPVPGRAFVEARPSPAIELTWRPVYVEVAASGDLGYTTGPYEVRSTDPAKSAEIDRGYYVTMWRKQADGAWKVAVDIGVETPPPAAPEGGEIGHGRIAGGPPPAGQGAADSARRDLLAAERAFGGDAGAHGARAAYLTAMADEARFYRDGAPPAVGREAAAKLLGAGKQRATSWKVTEAAAASSGDLGYAYGETAVMDTGAPRRIRTPGLYFRIWERQGNGRWKIVLDLVKELPPPASSAAPRPPAAPSPPESAPRPAR